MTAPIHKLDKPDAQSRVICGMGVHVSFNQACAAGKDPKEMIITFVLYAWISSRF